MIAWRSASGIAVHPSVPTVGPLQMCMKNARATSGDGRRGVVVDDDADPIRGIDGAHLLAARPIHRPGVAVDERVVMHRAWIVDALGQRRNRPIGHSEPAVGCREAEHRPEREDAGRCTPVAFLFGPGPDALSSRVPQASPVRPTTTGTPWPTGCHGPSLSRVNRNIVPSTAFHPPVTTTRSCRDMSPCS